MSTWVARMPHHAPRNGSAREGGVAPRGSRESLAHGEVEKEGQVGCGTERGKPVQSLDDAEREASTVSLVCDRRVREPVAQHDLAGVEGGADDLGEMLGARRLDQEQL